MGDIKNRLEEFLTCIRGDLDKCMDFWMKYSHDDTHGGFFNCLGKDGKCYDEMKYGWLQGRQVWTYAHLYVERSRFHKPEVLAAAEKGAEFLMRHIKGEPKCYFMVTRDGKPVKVQRTIFTECFYVMAMAAMHRATSKQHFRTEAVTMMERIMHWVRVDDSELGRPNHAGQTETNSMAVPMMTLCLVQTLVTMDNNLKENYIEFADWSVAQIKAHIQRQGSLILEHVGKDGAELPGCQGRLVIPGHAIECGWFLLEYASLTGNKELHNLALNKFITNSFEYGWDSKCDGLFYFLDADGLCPTQLEWRHKLWWPHAEAMIAFLMAYFHTKDGRHLDKFSLVFDYVYKHFCDSEHGEWFGYLQQDGNINMDFKGGPFKGCFHVPRCLLMCEQLLEKIMADTQK